MALLHHWPLNDNAASTTVVATVGTNATANANTSTLTTTGPGGAITAGFDFDGSSHEIDISAASVSFASGTAFSVSLWAEFDAGNGRMIGRTGSATHLIAKGSDTQIAVTGSTQKNFAVASLGTTNWHHVLVTRDTSNNLRVFVDGVESSTGAQTLAETFAPTRIGRGNTSYFDGKIAGVKIFDTDESANVAALFAEGSFKIRFQSGMHEGNMTQFLKQSTSRTIVLGPFVDSADGSTPETGLTISQADVRISKNGAAFAQTNNSAGAAHMENGYYGIPLDATDTNTTGPMRVAVNESGALPVWRDFLVLSPRSYARKVDGATFNARGGRVWYVAASGGSSSNPGTLSAPLDTIVNAIAAASPGDTIRVLAGTYAESNATIVVGVADLTIEGVGDSTHVSVDLPSTGDETPHVTPVFKIEAKHVTIRKMKITTVDGGTPIQSISAAGAADYFTGERLTLIGTYDGINLFGNAFPRLIDCRISGTFDGANLAYCRHPVCINTHFVTDGTYTPATRNRGLYAPQVVNGRFINCKFKASRTTATGENVSAIELGGDDFMHSEPCTAQFDNCTFEASATHASDTAGVRGIGTEANGGAWDIVLDGGQIITNNAGSGDTLDIDASLDADSTARVRGTTFDSAKTAGNVRAIDNDVANTYALASGANGFAATKTVADSISGTVGSGTHGNAALKTLIDDVPTVAEFNARTLAAASYATAAGLDELAETASDINIEPVPASRTFVLTPTTTGLRSETTRTITINSDPNTWAIDFRNDAAANQKVYSVEAPTITSGTAGGLTFGTPYREGTQAKVRITAVTAGTYTVRVIVRYGSATGPVAVGYLMIKAA